MVGWFAGAAINLIGSVAINLGTNVMKLGHNKRALLDMPEEQKPPVTKFREWQIGTVVFIIGNVANFVSFGFAAQSLLAALGSVQFVSNVFFASFVLKEKISSMVVIATLCIIGGCLTLVLFGNHSSADYTVSELLALYKAAPYIVYLVMMFVFVLGAYIMYLHGKSVAAQGRDKSIWVAVLPVTYSIFSALLGTQSVLFSKSLSVLLRTTFAGQSQLGNWYTWVTLVCFLVSAGFWVTRLNKGLRLFPAMIIVPLMQICWTLFSIVSGMIYFEEYTSFNPSVAKHGPLNAIMFCLGVSVVFAGVFLLTKSGQRKADEYEDLDDQVKSDAIEIVNNPAFEDGTAACKPQGTPPHSPRLDPDVPQKDKLNLDTLRFTSLASSTAANIKDITKVQRKSALAATSSPNRGQQQLGVNGTLESRTAPGSPALTSVNGAVESVAGEGDMALHSTLASHRKLGTIASDNGSLGSTALLGTLKQGAKKISRNLRKDFNVDLDELKQVVGMGQGGYMPALSLFAMPAVDLTASKKSRKKAEALGPTRHSIMLSSLPQSRFYTRDVEGGLEETQSEDLDLAARERLMGGGELSSSAAEHGMAHFPYNNSTLATNGNNGAGAIGLLRQSSSPGRLRQAGSAASSTAGGYAGYLPAGGGGDPSLLKGIMTKTIQQVAKAKDKVEAGLQRMKDQQANPYLELGGEAPAANDDEGTGPHTAVDCQDGSPQRPLKGALQHTTSGGAAGALPGPAAAAAGSSSQSPVYRLPQQGPVLWQGLAGSGGPSTPTRISAPIGMTAASGAAAASAHMGQGAQAPTESHASVQGAASGQQGYPLAAGHASLPIGTGVVPGREGSRLGVQQPPPPAAPTPPPVDELL